MHKPNQTISDLPLLTQTEQYQILVEWNQTQQDYPDKCFHQLFEEQVTLTPDSVAVVSNSPIKNSINALINLPIIYSKRV
jgi:non-ribosomal peptide synthetase component F